MLRLAFPVLALLVLGGCATSPTEGIGGKWKPANTKKCDVVSNPGHPQCSVKVEASINSGSCALKIDTDFLHLVGNSMDRSASFNLSSLPGFNARFDPAEPIKFYRSKNGAKDGAVLRNPPFKVTIEQNGRMVLVPSSSDQVEYAYSVHVTGNYKGNVVKCDSDPIIKNGGQ